MNGAGRRAPREDAPIHILFLCAGNSARSILAEAILNRIGDGRFRAFSAGTAPVGKVHPLTLELLATLGIPTRGLRSKGLQEYAGSAAPVMDAVVIVCEEPAIEALPALPGAPLSARWKIPDPVPIDWDDAASRAAFLDAYLALHARISRLVAIPPAAPDREGLRRCLEEIGTPA
jgi:arsenate reductase